MHLSRLKRDDRGVSAVEFALIAPILILLYMGLAELTLGMMAERRASHAASAMGDLLAQNKDPTTTAEIDAIFTAGRRIVAPFPTTTNMSLALSSVRADAAGVAKVTWSRAVGVDLSKLTQGSTPASFPANLIAANESVIMAQVVYVYDSPLKKVVPNALKFREVFYLRPRRIDEVTCPGCPA